MVVSLEFYVSFAFSVYGPLLMRFLGAFVELIKKLKKKKGLMR